jgi:ABC-type lipopolysaccharide export system ATPase subunit
LSNTKLIEALYDRMYLIEKGQIKLDGKVKEIYSDDGVRKAYLGR